MTVGKKVGGKSKAYVTDGASIRINTVRQSILASNFSGSSLSNYKKHK
jgi:hypothetical protein